MTFFKKTQEPDNFGQLVVDFILAKAQNFNSRFASVSDAMALASVEMLIDEEIKNGTFGTRLAASVPVPTQKDLQQVRAKYMKQLREALEDAEAKGLTREEAKPEIMRKLRAEFASTVSSRPRGPKTPEEIVRDYFMTELYRRKYQLKVEEPENSIFDYLHLSNKETNEQGFLDYLLKTEKDPETGESKFLLNLNQDPSDLVSAAVRGIQGGVGRSNVSKDIQKKKKETSTEQSLGGGKADSADVTLGEGLKATNTLSPEQLLIEQEERAEETDPLKNLRVLAVQFKASNIFPELQNIEPMLDKKKVLFEKRFLDDEEMAQYDSLSKEIFQRVNAIKEGLIGSRAFQAIPEGPTRQSKAAQISELAFDVADMYIIPGYQTFEVPAEAPEAMAPATPAALGFGSFKANADAHFENMLPYIYSSMDLHPAGSEMSQVKANSPRLIRKMKQSIPYGEGIETKAQQDAIISGDQEAMNAAGVPPIAQFNRDLLQLVHDWQVQSLWEGGKGQKLVDSPYKKSANDNFFAGIAKLAEKYKDYPEVQQRIAEEYTAARTKMVDGQKVTEGKTTWQATQEDFDALRINAEFMKLLESVGRQVSGQPFTSFSQLSGVDPAIIDSALDQIVAEETHFGGGLAWLPQKVGPFLRGRLHQFDPASFKTYLKKSLDSMISGAARSPKSPKNVAWWQHGQPSDTEGITPVVRRKAPGSDSTQLGQDDENQGLVQTMSFYHDEDEDEKPHKVRRFKVVVR
jgi:hypothetical protein